MNCPSCNNNLSESNFRGVQTYTCKKCRDIWISGQALSLLLRMEHSDLSAATTIRVARCSSQSNRSCVSCNEMQLYTVKLKHIEVDSCEACGGIYFDSGEIERLLPGKEVQDSSEGSVWADQAATHVLGAIINSLIS